MNFDAVEFVTIIANLGVIAGLVFLAVEVRQNNRFLAAQARYSLRQYRSDIVDTFIAPHVSEALHKYSSGEEATPAERSIAIMTALKVFELWEWQWGEYTAGLLQLHEVPVVNWRIWYHGKGATPVPLAEVWPGRKSALNPEFVRFFEKNVIDYESGAHSGGAIADGES
jgi:hypothetical protein